MKIDFNAMETQIIPHMRGGEKEMRAEITQDNLCKIMHGRLIPGGTVGFHCHETDSEILYVISGEANFLCDEGRIEIVRAGECHYCPRGTSHSLRNLGTEDVVFFAVIPQHEVPRD